MAAASLRYPNIVALHEVGFLDSQHFIATELVAGSTLDQFVAANPTHSHPTGIRSEKPHFAGKIGKMLS